MKYDDRRWDIDGHVYSSGLVWQVFLGDVEGWGVGEIKGTIGSEGIIETVRIIGIVGVGVGISGVIGIFGSVRDCFILIHLPFSHLVPGMQYRLAHLFRQYPPIHLSTERQSVLFLHFLFTSIVVSFGFGTGTGIGFTGVGIGFVIELFFIIGV